MLINTGYCDWSLDWVRACHVSSG